MGIFECHLKTQKQNDIFCETVFKPRISKELLVAYYQTK